MRKMLMALAATAALGTAAFTAPASAAEVQKAPVNELVAAVQKGDVKSDYVQYRRYYRGGPRYVERRYYGRPYYGSRYGYRRYDRGNALAAGAIGLATGAIIGGAIANSQAQAAPAYGGSAAAYCAQRFRSYDPASGTYMGYDGVRRSCP
ncbi:BA14K family protein [Microvirga sp. ACRRW]|uniref:BA14K family protein n=1 Tax=Microvirga sp. ACRRW TaxID=2918205 RepID=UPI001EF3EE6D|nr:BA14K family protein [Microvirga sp. ACRRW]MCG7392757.1 BA14K family protein [Microvirga sp. ACRRW]